MRPSRLTICQKSHTHKHADYPNTRSQEIPNEKQFIQIMQQGNTTAALRYLSEKQSSILQPTPHIIEELQKKHPASTPPSSATLPLPLPPPLPLPLPLPPYTYHFYSHQ
eukprot:GHVR01166606.1.p1 GENE.GHVR01166606.1~~GHVR01166606.1.p1  ORF type:complete len:109 (-),score=27.61 GHVR01166606.1:141-467(-)